MLEVHVAERGERLGARLHDDEDALPRLHGERRVAVLEVAVAEVDEVPRVGRSPLCARRCSTCERLVVLADARVEVGDARRAPPRRCPPRASSSRHELQRARAVAALEQRLALLEDELRVVRRGADEAVVLGDGLVEVAVGLEQADHAQAQVDLRAARCASARLYVSMACVESPVSS